MTAPGNETRPGARAVGAVRQEDALAPLFLIGAPRSGTSLLYKALCLHPDAAWISNWVRRFPRRPWTSALNHVARAFPSVERAVWFGRDSNAYVYASPRTLLKRLFPQPVEGEPLYAACGIPERDGAPAASRERQREALREALSSVRRWSGGRRLVNKRIANNLRIPLLVEAFPEARFVELVRDGRAVAYSLSRVNWWEESRVWWYGGTPRRWREDGRDPWELCARVWVEELSAIERGLRSVPSEHVLRVAYEGLVREPLETLEAIAAFGGLSPDPEWRARLATLDFPDRNEAWRKRLDERTIALVTRIQEADLRKHGYVA